MLSIKNIYKHFDDTMILDNISFDVNKGEIALLLGASGAGKSTLLRVLNSLEKINAGTVTLNDKPLDLSKTTQEHVCGMVFQHFNLFTHLTARKNITLALEKTAGKTKEQADSIADGLLVRYGLGDKANDYPDQLSGGQKQRLAIARSIALEPQIICFDEPTSALDPILTAFFIRNVQELAKQGYIIVIATHDTVLMKQLKCTIYLMEDGQIVEKASSQEFHKQPLKYPRLDTFVSGHSYE